MEMKKKQQGRPALGRGLSALISTKPVSVVADNSSNAAVSVEVSGEGISYLDIGLLVPNPSQPRQYFDEAEIRELAESIKALGVLQPILVRKAKDQGKYEIVAGERRWRASLSANLLQVPVIIKDLSEKDALEIALVENVQRSDLNPLEEARAYQRLIEEFTLTQSDVAQKVGKDRVTISNMIRILALPAPIQELIREGKLTSGHAKAILTVKEPSAQISLAKKTVAEGLSVRALENIVARVVVLDSRKDRGGRGRRGLQKSALSAFPEVVDRMRNSLATKVSINHHPSGRGKIEIEYFSTEELDRIVERICSAN